MIITVVSEGQFLRVLETSAPIPPGEPLELYTRAEIDQLVAKRIWCSLPQESRDNLMFQTQSASYQDWMNEDEWDAARLRDDSRFPSGPVSS